jgi:mono/diheme cytochrome c family protein
MEQAYVYAAKEDFEFKKGVWNTGTDHLYGDLPEDPLALLQVAANSRGHLVAWDPVQQKEVWRYQQAGPWNGGALSTGGNLVFQGNLLGEFVAYSADKGERLWAFATQTGITAGPVTYELDGEQYVSVAVGWGTMIGLLGGPTMAPFKMQNKSRVLTFKLGASNALPGPDPMPARGVLAPPPQTASDADVQRGHALYAERCMVCHGLSAMSGGLLSDLRYSSPETFATWDAIVVGGSKGIIGMPGYAGILSMEESQAIKAYIIDRAHAAQ